MAATPTHNPLWCQGRHSYATVAPILTQSAKAPADLHPKKNKTRHKNNSTSKLLSSGQRQAEPQEHMIARLCTAYNAHHQLSPPQLYLPHALPPCNHKPRPKLTNLATTTCPAAEARQKLQSFSPTCSVNCTTCNFVHAHRMAWNTSHQLF